ncbi:signal peptidase complex catalytic subunit SEC11C-like isoform X1 [Oryza brachyantha]|uniref:signal peptidase I n=1 Tax=Oryza brachyantha TaxID=4533 RepID=J3LIN0_ORYBR|nr:signal peptidase complex catalytic subunit SEC11C-like isoform X1 [Oryza brachyantha]
MEFMVVEPIRIRHALLQIFTLGMVITSALIIWKGLVVMTGSESPVVVVLSESMEPGFERGDILFLHMTKDPIRTGEIVVYNDGREIPIVHRVIEVHERRDSAQVDVLTKGDNNDEDDRMLYTNGQLWLQQHHIMGRAVGYLPKVGWVTLVMTEKPVIKYLLIAALGLLLITSPE